MVCFRGSRFLFWFLPVFTAVGGVLFFSYVVCGFRLYAVPCVAPFLCEFCLLLATTQPNKFAD